MICMVLHHPELEKESKIENRNKEIVLGSFNVAAEVLEYIIDFF